MDKRVEKLKTPEQCARFARNAIDKDRPDLAEQARKRAVQLRADTLGAKSEAEKEALQAVFAYEEVLTRKNGKRTRASRTWQMIDRHGIIEAVERAVNRTNEPQGYTALVEMGLEEYAFEAVILRHPSVFSKKAVLHSQARLKTLKAPEALEAQSDNLNSKFTTIQDTSRIAEAQSAFENRARNAASQSGMVKLGYQGGGKSAMVYQVSPLNFWISVADSSNRFWNALGIGDPFHDGSTIIAEINPPKSGIDRNIGGVFIEDENGSVHLAHRGKVGGGRTGIGKNAFLDWYQEPLDLVYDDDRHSLLIVIGALDNKALMEKLARFTHSISAFKEQAVA